MSNSPLTDSGPLPAMLELLSSRTPPALTLLEALMVSCLAAVTRSVTLLLPVVLLTVAFTSRRTVRAVPNGELRVTLSALVGDCPLLQFAVLQLTLVVLEEKMRIETFAPRAVRQQTTVQINNAVRTTRRVRMLMDRSPIFLELLNG